MAVGLRPWVVSAADAMQDELRGVGARLRVRRGRPPRVKGDATELGLVVSNLLRNAISAVRGAPPDERRIDVGALARAGRVWVVVGDRGCGLPPGSADRVLDPLFTTWPEGTGLGLAICRAIVEGHGGMFRVRPRAGGGGVFGFCLEKSS